MSYAYTVIFVIFITATQLGQGLAHVIVAMHDTHSGSSTHLADISVITQGMGSGSSTHRTPLVLTSSCSASGDCSAKLQSLLSACTGTSNCTIRFTPPNADFSLEQANALTATEVQGLAIEGNGARLSFQRGDAPFLSVNSSSNVVLANFTLRAARVPFTYGVVQNSSNTSSKTSSNSSTGPGPGVVTLTVDVKQYPLDEPWTWNVAAMHEVTTDGYEPCHARGHHRRVRAMLCESAHVFARIKLSTYCLISARSIKLLCTSGVPGTASLAGLLC